MDRRHSGDGADELVRPTPFHKAAAAMSKTNAWTASGSFTVAETYTTLDEEYQAIRRAVGVCDYSPLMKYRVSGNDASAYLNRLLTRNIEPLKINQSAFSPYCDDRGHVIEKRRRRCHLDRKIWCLSNGHTGNARDRNFAEILKVVSASQSIDYWLTERDEVSEHHVSVAHNVAVH